MSKTSEPREVSTEISERLREFLGPLLEQLDAVMDKRLVRTFFALVQTVIPYRHRTNGLLLSELGAYLLSPEKAPAGTKRISNLLRSQRWSYLIERFLWVQASLGLNALEKQQDSALLVWDESV